MSKLLIKQEPKPGSKNGYFIYLGDDHFAIVDADDYYRLNNFHWTWYKSHSKIYAVRKKRFRGKEIVVRMHREIAQTPPGLDCHHVNRNSLDNRKVNLVNLNPIDHHYMHSTGSCY